MNYITNILCFTLGAAAGAAVTYLVVKRKYEQRAEEDIEAMKKVYHKKAQEEKGKEEVEPSKVEEPQRPPSVVEYQEVVKELYTPKIQPDDTTVRPYPISENAYNEPFDGFDKVRISWYEEDGTLADEDYIYDDLDYTIGKENLAYFGTNNLDDPDVMYIRNERGGFDAEVTCVHGSYDYFDGDYPPSEDD